MDAQRERCTDLTEHYSNAFTRASPLSSLPSDLDILQSSAGKGSCPDTMNRRKKLERSSQHDMPVRGLDEESGFVKI